MNDKPQVRIVSTGMPHETIVYVDGVALTNVTRCEWSIEPGEYASATITLDNVALEAYADPASEDEGMATEGEGGMHWLEWVGLTLISAVPVAALLFGG